MMKAIAVNKKKFQLYYIFRQKICFAFQSSCPDKLILQLCYLLFEVPIFSLA